MKKLSPLFVLMFYLFTLADCFAQSATVRGKITDSGDPLPGVTILIKGATFGTTTDVNGEFSLNVPNDGILVISYTGYQTKEVPVNGRTYIAETIKIDNKQLEEVVVIGYQ